MKAEGIVGWFDILLVVPFVAVVLWTSRQEAGRAAFDAVATLAAAHFSNALTPAASFGFGFVEAAGDTSPTVHAVLFTLLFAFGLVCSWWLHRYTRWSLDVLDPLAGTAMGFIIAFTAGHAIVETGFAVVQEHGARLPQYVQNSRVADELCHFRSYVYVLDVFEKYQRGGTFAD